MKILNLEKDLESQRNIRKQDLQAQTNIRCTRDETDQVLPRGKI